ncbi:aspartate aminotransferase family protein [Streptomyces sp. NPDC058534]|uniref:aspartate aminotransferase family protein n=1 Tax=Streptomyces sp. NPDC058534 TaxID=3346541 RepID=UPI0036637639
MMDHHKSRELFERAQQSLAGGTSSSSRITTTGTEPHPLYMESGSGAHIRDVDGNTYVDYLLSYGSAVLGHANPLLTEALSAVLASGTMFGTCNVPEVELAERICASVPCADLVRYANSGSEAVQGAVRAARGFTGRSVVVKFEGHYHGWTDTLAVSAKAPEAEVGPYHSPAVRPHSRGIPQGVLDDVLVCPWNDVDVLRSVLDAHRGRIAAVICEPIVANNACTMPLPGFLETLREECTDRDIVLIFDEVCTGFRTGPGGAQALFGVVPDLAVYSKALGGGIPLSAFAGRRDIMEQVGDNRIKHGGTYNGSPLCATAALVTVDRLSDPAVQRSIDEAGRRVMEAIRRASRDHGIPCAVQGVGAMFQVVFSADGSPTRHYRDLFAADLARYQLFRHELLRRGIHVNVYGLACWFVSAALNEDDIDRTCTAVYEAFAAL